MTKSTISAACASILIIIDENKKLLEIAKRCEDQTKNKICEMVESSRRLANELTDHINKISLRTL